MLNVKRILAKYEYGLPEEGYKQDILGAFLMYLVGDELHEILAFPNAHTVAEILFQQLSHAGEMEIVDMAYKLCQLRELKEDGKIIAVLQFLLDKEAENRGVNKEVYA